MRLKSRVILPKRQISKKLDSARLIAVVAKQFACAARPIHRIGKKYRIQTENAGGLDLDPSVSSQLWVAWKAAQYHGVQNSKNQLTQEIGHPSNGGRSGHRIEEFAQHTRAITSTINDLVVKDVRVRQEECSLISMDRGSPEYGDVNRRYKFSEDQFVNIKWLYVLE